MPPGCRCDPGGGCKGSFMVWFREIKVGDKIASTVMDGAAVLCLEKTPDTVVLGLIGMVDGPRRLTLTDRAFNDLFKGAVVA